MSKIRLSKSCIGAEEKAAVARILDEEHLGMGSEVQLFEQELQAFIGNDRKVACVSTGTAALQLALQACGCREGTEVLVPSLTYVASFQAISATGYTPIACDINPSTGFICVEDMKRKLTEKTIAIMPVHYASHFDGIEAVYTLAKEHNLRVIEDAAHSFGCVRNKKRIGAVGDIVCFSFDGIKNITSGEGGAVVTGDTETFGKICDSRLLGVQKDTEQRYAKQRSWEFDVTEQGWRYHMSNIMAAIGREQLKKIDHFGQHRRSVVKRYSEGLASCPCITPLFKYSIDHIPHIFPIVVDENKRPHLRQHLLDQGIEVGIHYKPNHLLSKYQGQQCPNSEILSEQLLTLPCHADLSNEEVETVIKTCLDYFS